MPERPTHAARLPVRPAPPSVEFAIGDADLLAPPRGSVERIARWFAICGGMLLAGLSGLIVASALGRHVLAAPIPGDNEIANLMTGAGVALMLPYCQIRKGNVIVDVFTLRASPRARAVLDAIGSLCVGAIGFLLAWRLGLGAWDLYRYNDETMMLRLPTWIGLIPVVPSFVLLGVASLVTLRRDLRPLVSPAPAGGA